MEQRRTVSLSREPGGSTQLSFNLTLVQVLLSVLVSSVSLGTVAFGLAKLGLRPTVDGWIREQVAPLQEALRDARASAVPRLEFERHEAEEARRSAAGDETLREIRDRVEFLYRNALQEARASNRAGR